MSNWRIALEPWFEVLGVSALATGGVGVGYWISRFRRPFWLIWYIVALLVVVMIGVGRWVEELYFYQPFTWIMTGRRECVLLAVSTAILLAALLPKLRSRRVRVLVMIFFVLVLIHYSFRGILGPAMCQQSLSGIKTVFDRSGICMQQTDYTCMSAAAVTALRRFGIESNEGEIAIRAYTSRDGTTLGLLTTALEELYGKEGLTCDYHKFQSVEELRDICPVITLVKYSKFLDHAVTVLEVTDRHVVVGDPLVGRLLMTFQEFEDQWYHTGVVLKRQTHDGVGERKSK